MSYASKSNTLNTSKSDDEELDNLRKAALKTISSTKQPNQPPSIRPTTHNMENNPYNNYPGDFRRHNNYHPHHHHPQHHSLPARLPPHHMQPQPPQHLHQPATITPPFYNPPQMQPRFYPPVQQYGIPPSHPVPMAGNQLWDRDYNSATSAMFSPGASLVPTNVQLSPRSQAFVAENNDILLKRKGDRFLRRSRSKSWSRTPSPHGRSSSSYKNGRRFSPRKRSLSNSSGESPSGRKYSRKNPRQHSPKSQEDQKKDTPSQPKRRGGSPISFNLESKKDNHQQKEPAPQKITLNRNRIIQLNSSSKNSNNSRTTWNRNNVCNRSQPSNSNVSKTKDEEKVEKKEEKPQLVESKPQPEPVAPNPPVVETKKPPPVVKPPRVKTAEELLEDELLRSDDELDDGILLTNDDLDIDLFESESESENEGRFKSKITNSKDSPLSFSKLGDKYGGKIRPLDDVIDKGGNRGRGYDKGSRISNSISRKSGQNDKDKKSEKKPLEFRKLALDRKKSYEKEPPRKVIIGRSSGNNLSIGGIDLNKQQPTGVGPEKKSIYSRLGGKTSTSDGLDIKREKV